jgi:hypothetical protein
MEKHLGRYLAPKEHIHHINGDGTDNRIENRQIVSASEHQKLHIGKHPSSARAASIKALKDCAARRKILRIETGCACGCGGKFVTPDSKGRYHKYLSGHATKGKTWKWRENVN